MRSTSAFRLAGICGVLVMGFGSIATAEGLLKIPRPKKGGAAVQDSPLVRGYTWSIGRSAFRFGVTRHGNIMNITSPQGPNHIYAEGYAIAVDDELVAFDFAEEEGGFGPTRIQEPNGRGQLPIIFTRAALDGTVLLQQVINATPDQHAIQIGMSILNRGETTLPNVEVGRFFDADMDGESDNDFGTISPDSATIQSIFPGNSLSLTALSYSTPHWVGLFPYEEPDEEAPGAAAGGPRIQGPTPIGDWVGVVAYELGDLPPGEIRRFRFRYLRK